MGHKEHIKDENRTIEDFLKIKKTSYPQAENLWFFGILSKNQII